MNQTPTTPEIVQDIAPEIIFFDGVCGLCNGVVDWLIGLGKMSGHFQFAPLQGETARRTLPRTRVQNLDRIVLQKGDQVFERSTAALMIFKGLRGWEAIPLRLLASLMLLIPSRIRDFAYDWVAAHRYEFFGRRESCRLPTPAERKRFLP